MEKVKAKDLAKILGISQATISLVLNNKPGLSDKTRENIVRQINDMGYGYLFRTPPEEPSKSRNIAFITYRNQGELLGFNSFFPLIIDGIESRARLHGYNLNFIQMDKQDIENQIGYIKESACIGYVIFATEMHQEDVEAFLKLKIPFVLLDNSFKDIEVNVVKVNNEHGTYLAVKHLVEMGHKQLGYLSSGVDIESFAERQECAVRAAKKVGLPEPYVYTIGYPSDQAYEGMIKVLDGKFPLPTAFMADNDLVAVGAMKAARERGFDIPADISFIGYDDRPACTLVEPNLSSILLPRESFGAEAVELLVRLIREKQHPLLEVEINGKLVRRDSVAKL